MSEITNSILTGRSEQIATFVTNYTGQTRSDHRDKPVNTAAWLSDDGFKSATLLGRSDGTSLVSIERNIYSS